MAKEFQAQWKPLEFLVKEIYLISREGTNPFSIKCTIPLGVQSKNTLSTGTLLSSIYETEPSDILGSIKTWILSKTEKQLPKTVEKLSNTIRHNFRPTFKFNSEIIFQLLVKQGYIRLADNKIFLTEKRGVDSIQSSFKERSINDQELIQTVFEKTVKWLHNSPQTPKSITGLHNGLKQICQLKQEVNLTEIIASLETEGIIQIEHPNDFVKYKHCLKC